MLKKISARGYLRLNKRNSGYVNHDIEVALYIQIEFGMNADTQVSRIARVAAGHHDLTKFHLKITNIPQPSLMSTM